MIDPPLLVQVLRQPDCVAGMQLANWDDLVRQARKANLLASLRALLDRKALLDRIHPGPRRHLDWAWTTSERHREAVHWEVRWIAQALQHLELPLILLKGAAYVCADLPPAAGRVFSDIDILVPKERLPEVEAALMLNGWVSTHLDAYDQRYYREWMHELPPMKHLKRGTAIDVHHAILPETASTRPCPQKLLKECVRVAGTEALWTLSPIDLVLHSAIHLFHEGEFDNALRDLFDIHLLIQSRQEELGFWTRLLERAHELEQDRALFYALRYSNILLNTAIPRDVLVKTSQVGPTGSKKRWMDRLFMNAFIPDHPSCRQRTTGIARKLLYVRANWLRMPSGLLARHLFHKAFISPKPHR